MPIPIPGRVAEALRRATVHIQGGNGRYEGNGSGGVLPDGQIVTNAHVAAHGNLIVETWEGQRVRGSVLKMDRRRDLALLSVPGLQAPALTLADSDLVRAGTPVVAIGNPMGFIGAASSGVVHAVGSLRSQGAKWIQADVRLAPGNSGGPLANLQGEVIGINTMIVSGGLAMAIPSRAVQTFLARKKSTRSLGVVVRPVQLRDRGTALLVLELVPYGAAEAASLLPGDLLFAVNGSRIESTGDLIESAQDSTLRVQFYRGGQERAGEVAVRLTENQVLHAA
ncbi:MAG: trypsin-like peptidase domain-containing protein [Acidobacteriota bacterium]|nr:trypsin-like peptidase domain-containing protein [Acidobacteriota bacterium]